VVVFLGLKDSCVEEGRLRGRRFHEKRISAMGSVSGHGLGVSEQGFVLLLLVLVLSIRLD
jgi:hypothetical protein